MNESGLPVPVRCVTPRRPGCIHRFFDTSPFSPSGRYLAVFQLPFEDRQPRPGEAGHVVLVDLHTGEDWSVAETCGWEPQVGANINWGGSDHELFFNDVDTATGEAFAWKRDPLTGARQRLEGTVYHASPDGRLLVSADLAAMRRTQPGYGVRISDERVRRNIGPADDDGFFLTDTATGRRRLLVSIQDLLARADPPACVEDPARQEIYAFHAKFNPQGDRLMVSLRWFPAGDSPVFNMFSLNYPAVRYAWFTLRPDGSDIHCAIGPEHWEKGGHHATWCPDGRQISMNLNIDRQGMRFVRVNADGSGLATLREDVLGSGHPTVHPDGRHLITDAYGFEPMAFPDGTVPLRWVDLKTGAEETLVRVPIRQPCTDEIMRVDPHPAWDCAWQRVAFNGFDGITRRVYVADFSKKTNPPKQGEPHKQDDWTHGRHDGGTGTGTARHG